MSSRIFKKLGKKLIIGLLAILVIGTPLLYLTLLNSKSAQAAWFDDNWLYRKSIAITNNTTAETNVYISVTIDTSDTSKFQGDCGDLRFTKQNGDLLPYYVISGCTTSSTVIRVEFDTFPAGAQTIYYYYGNPGAVNGSAALTTASYYSGAGDGYIGNGTGANWAGVHDATDGDVTDPTGTGFSVGTAYWGPNSFDILRGFIPIDTSGLPDTAVITTATFNLYMNGKSDGDNDGDDWLNVVGQTSQASTSTLVAGDFDQCGAVSNPTEGATRLDITNMTLNAYNTWTLDATGIGWIDKTGVSKLGLREGHDAINSAISTGDNRNSFISSETSGTSQDPYLSVTYYTSSITTEASNYTVGTIGSEEKAPGPKLYWNFDDGQGTTAQDSSSNNLDGTLNNTPTWNTEDLCLSGKCLYFDGSNNENVSRADNALLDFAAADNFTISAWVRKSGAASANTVILGKASANIGATYQGYKLYMDASGDFCFDTQDGTLAVDTACTSAVDFDDDKWHLVQGVKTGTTNITLYVDGKQRAQDASIASTGSLANSGTFYAGIDSDGLAIEWKGFIDEVKVYDYARSASQIQADYSSRGSVKGASAVLGAKESKALSEGLVGYWKLDDNVSSEGQTVADSSGNGNTGTLYGDNSVGDNGSGMDCNSGGKFGYGCTFDSTDDYISLSALPSSASGTNARTIAFWFYPLAFDTGTLDGILALASGSTGANFELFAEDNGVAVAYNGHRIILDKNNLSTSTWYHVVVTLPANATSDQTKGYINGVEKAFTTETGSPLTVNTDADPIIIGSNWFGTNPFNGTLDEVRIYNRALSDREIRDLYNFAPGPKVNLKMEEGSDTTANDSSGNSNNGTVNSGTWTTGKYGKGVNLNGTSGSNVSVPDFAY